MELVVFYFLHFYEIQFFVSFLEDYLLEEESSLFDWDDFVSSTMHHHNPALDFCDEVNVSKVIFFELDVDCVLVVEHTGE